MINRITRIFGTSLVVCMAFQLCAVNINAQNLVKNPSFEDLVQCPQEYGTLSEDALFWKQPTYGSSDYFNGCSDTMPVNQNFIGYQETYNGDAYAGLYAYGPKDYREYLEGELKQKLKKGTKYNFSFQISLAEKSKYAINEFGILFMNKTLNLHTKRNIPYNLMNTSGLYNYVSINNPKYYKDKDDWVTISGEYVADGTEQFFIIGNFKSNAHTHRTKLTSHLKDAAYYYVDYVVVEPANGIFKLDEIYVLENLLFKVNDHKIEGEGKKQLQTLISYLKDKPNLNIEIYGHTDNVGSKKHNKELSQKRAKAVGRFLVDNGLSPFRIAWKGFGDESPVAENETQAGRDKNRRVEFLISKKKRDTYASGLFEDEN